MKKTNIYVQVQLKKKKVNFSVNNFEILVDSYGYIIKINLNSYNLFSKIYGLYMY